MILLPEILTESCEGHTANLQLRVPPELAHFPGHFPSNPLLPGVVQIDWAVRLAERHFSLPRQRFSQLKGLKFTSPVLPGTELNAQLTWLEEKSRLEFTFSAGSRACAAGQIIFSACPDQPAL